MHPSLTQHLAAIHQDELRNASAEGRRPKRASGRLARLARRA
jgi:hypothetical protein